MKSPAKLKQSKITAFCLKLSGNASAGGNAKKRKSEEVCELYLSPKKKAARSKSRSPDGRTASPEKNRRAGGREERESRKENENDLENFHLGDFENDPFLSPRKEKSPRENVLTENCSLLYGEDNGLEEKREIGFEVPVRCKVVRSTFLTKKGFEQVLTVADEKSGRRGECRLRDVWTSCSFAVDDLVSVQAVQSDGSWIVDNKHGYVVLCPDVVISSTTLSSSMFCMRQGLLSTFFKGLDTEGGGRMLTGRLVHELFQESLRRGAASDEDFAAIIADSLRSEATLRDVYFSDLKVSEIESQMRSFVPRVRNFLETYVNKRTLPAGKNFDGTIEDVLDIEELIRSPSLGFQGRIDVTVRMKTKNSVRVAPLELKTGRASFSSEHRAQLILYILLMNELGRQVESGLLLYLREDAMEEVLPQRDEVRNLFLLRNHFVGFYKGMRTYNLPDPIRNGKCCSKCSFLRVCTTYLKAHECESLSENHPLRELEVPDIKPAHVDYFITWHKMLWLEYERESGENPGDSEISRLTLQSVKEDSKEEFKYVFRKPVDSGGKSFRPGNFVTVLNGRDARVCAGHVVEVTDSSVCLVTDKKLEDFSDTYKITAFQSKFLHMYLTNLGFLLGKEFESLREILVDRRPPSFEKNLDKKDFQEKCLNNLLDLNKDQQKAILKSLLSNDYLLIKGPPGTGKTQTIVALVKILLAYDKTVLVASHTHSSVDNILLKLGETEYLRLGSLKSIHKDVHRNAYAELVKSCRSARDVGKLFDRKLIASTCLGIDADFLQKKKFDVCVVDESSQVLQPEILRPLFCCRKFILVGDEDQLPPIVQNSEAKKLGMDKSIFEWLRNEAATVGLRLQYRMNSVINSLANGIAYKGAIECANEETAAATIRIGNPRAFEEADEWIRDILSPELDKSVVFVDTSECFESTNRPEGKRWSALEANIAVRLIGSLKEFGVRTENVGLIAPFWDQIALLRRKLAEGNVTEVELNTVDQYQGRDKEVILLSCTKENQAERETSEFELLSDKRRLTVAVTRAKHKLIILGDRKTIVRYEPFEKLLRNLRESQLIRLCDGRKGFSRESFLQ